MPSRSRRITPRANWTWLYAGPAAFFGLMLLVQLFSIPFPDSSTDGQSTWQILFFTAIFVVNMSKLGRQLSVNDRALFIGYGLSSAAVRWDCIESFQWRHNVHNLGQRGKRLWVALDDGQLCPTPVVTGSVGMGRTDIGMSQADADALVAQLEARRVAAVRKGL